MSKKEIFKYCFGNKNIGYTPLSYLNLEKSRGSTKIWITKSKRHGTKELVVRSYYKRFFL